MGTQRWSGIGICDGLPAGAREGPRWTLLSGMGAVDAGCAGPAPEASLEVLGPWPGPQGFRPASQ